MRQWWYHTCRSARRQGSTLQSLVIELPDSRQLRDSSRIPRCYENHLTLDWSVDRIDRMIHRRVFSYCQPEHADMVVIIRTRVA